MKKLLSLLTALLLVVSLAACGTKNYDKCDGRTSFCGHVGYGNGK